MLMCIRGVGPGFFPSSIGIYIVGYWMQTRERLNLPVVFVLVPLI